ncbi:hypothetical protein C4573_06000 [Candidatus Woesearchaeota archaeon]|nr:MAG: hypothetical protein C4573_06000 [Candidatus Woesearchaeota archaeon]
MSKSKGNVVYQTDISDTYGIDTARFFLMSVATPDKVIEWRDDGVEGSYRFLSRVYALSDKKLIAKIDTLTQSKMHRTIKGVTETIDTFEYNKTTIAITEFVNYLQTLEELPKEAFTTLLLLIAPFTPHLAEELWEKAGQKTFISLASWPSFDEKKIDAKAEFIEETITNLTLDMRKVLEFAKIEQPKTIKIIISASWKYDFYRLLKKEIEKTRDMKLILQAVMAKQEFKQYGEDIAKLLPLILKDNTKLPSVILSQKEELQNLQKVSERIKGIFKADIRIEAAEKSTEAKAKNASPSKPAIVVT